MNKNSQSAIQIRGAVTEQILQEQSKKHLTNTKYAQMLMISCRFLNDLSSGRKDCGMLTLLFFLTFCCDDANAWIEDFRPVILKALVEDEEWYVWD